MSAPRRLLLVGAAGDLGTALAERLPALLGHDWMLLGVDLRDDPRRQIDRLDADACLGVDTIVHLAYLTYDDAALLVNACVNAPPEVSFESTGSLTIGMVANAARRSHVE